MFGTEVMGEKLFEGVDGLIELLFGMEGGRKGLHQAEFFRSL